MLYNQIDKIIDTSFTAKKPNILADKKMNIERIEEVSKEFNQNFLAEMLKPIYKNVQFDPLVPDSAASDLPRSILINHFGKILSEFIHFDKLIKEHLIKLQEVKNE